MPAAARIMHASGGSDLYGRLAMMLAMRGVVLALLVLRRVPGSHSPTVRIEGGAAELPLGCGRGRVAQFEFGE